MCLMPFLAAPGTRPCNSIDAVSQPLFPPPCFATLSGHFPYKIQDQAPPPASFQDRYCLGFQSSPSLGIVLAPAGREGLEFTRFSTCGGDHAQVVGPLTLLYRHQTVGSRISLSPSSPQMLRRNSLPFCSCHGLKGGRRRSPGLACFLILRVHHPPISIVKSRSRFS
jgi:hypothetical protein